MTRTYEKIDLWLNPGKNLFCCVSSLDCT